MGCHFLLQGIFPTQRLNLGLLRLLHWQVDSLPPGKPESYSTSVKWGERQHLPCRWAVLERKYKLGVGHSSCYYDGISGVQLGL